MGPKKNSTGKPRAPQIFVTEDVRLQILTKINDHRDLLYGETTPTNTTAMKHQCWIEILELCHKLGAKYRDVPHLKELIKRWKTAYFSKKREANKTGKGGTDVQMTACDEMLHQIVYGSHEVDTVEVIFFHMKSCIYVYLLVGHHCIQDGMTMLIRSWIAKG